MMQVAATRDRAFSASVSGPARLLDAARSFGRRADGRLRTCARCSILGLVGMELGALVPEALSDDVQIDAGLGHPGTDGPPQIVKPNILNVGPLADAAPTYVTGHTGPWHHRLSRLMTEPHYNRDIINRGRTHQGRSFTAARNALGHGSLSDISAHQQRLVIESGSKPLNEICHRTLAPANRHRRPRRSTAVGLSLGHRQHGPRLKCLTLCETCIPTIEIRSRTWERR